MGKMGNIQGKMVEFEPNFVQFYVNTVRVCTILFD